ncbi:hypothetical protein PDJAM_G00040770 [Pangasius djambal]|uniref:Uncharacterized protein n=1 Tax=Pangasius djambal TaxID=1691987 RepID=A0ACC5YST6_9TELE|nr:hypothetical protein [Pangasius djambal]
MDRGPANEKVESGYKTPPTCILLDLLLKSRRRRPSDPFNEVWPKIIISDARTATDLALLKTLRVTHIVNAAHGPAHIDTGSAFYSDAHIQYHGVEAPDSRDFDLSVFFNATADFVHAALTRD